MAVEQAFTSSNASRGFSRRSPITLSGRALLFSGSASNTTPSARLRSSFGTGKLSVRWGVSDTVLRVSATGERGRDLDLNREKPPSFSFSFCLSRPLSFRFWDVSSNLAADGETVGETASNLPSRREDTEARLFASFSFLRGKTFDRNAAIS